MPRKLKDDTYVDGPPPLEISAEAKEAVQEPQPDTDTSPSPTPRRLPYGAFVHANPPYPGFVPVPAQPSTTGAEDLADMIATLAAGDGLQVPAREWASGPWLLAAGALLKKGFDLRIAYIADEEPFYRVTADR